MKQNTVSIYQLFPFEKVQYGSEIILYGFGKIGKRYLAQIEETGYCKVKYIVDQNASAYKDFHIPVYTVDFLNKDENACIVISVYSKIKRKEIIDAIKERGIHENQIVIGEHRIAIEEGITGGSDMFHWSYFTKKEAEKQLGCGFLDFWKNLNRELKVQKILGKSLIRIGKDEDGGYVMIDDFKSGRIAYSFGISDDVSWDTDMADKGYEIFMYDHTINFLICDHRGFHFKKRGIADSKEKLQDLDSLEHYLEENGHKDNSDMILKMDVEGAERGFFNLVSQNTLKKFDQIVFELHGLLTEGYRNSILSALRKVNETHLLFHIHANNHGNVIWIDGEPFPEFLELSFVKKGLYKTEEAEDLQLPLEIDRACLKEYPDIVLGNWNMRKLKTI